MSGGTETIDLNFQGVEGVIACFVRRTDDGPVLIDPGPSTTLPRLRDGLRALGLKLGDVRHVLLTHIHFDHAGCAGSIAAETGARVYVHERGARHLNRPERLVASATQIYGDQMDRLWGELRPIPEEQLVALQGGETLELGGWSVQGLYTPGHAVHHLAWAAGDELFCGDVAGIRLDPAQSPRAPTPPPDIDLEAWRESVSRLRERGARTLHLTHYGSHPDSADHWDALLHHMHVDAERVREPLQAGVPAGEITEAFTRAQELELAEVDPSLLQRMRFASPPWMSVQGLVRYWQRREARGKA